MGSISQTQAPGPNVDADKQRIDDLGGSPPARESDQAIPEHEAHYPQQQQSNTSQPSQHPFAAQLDLRQSPPGGRPDSYNMASMVNSLPNSGFRPGQFPHGNQQRYNPPSSSPMLHQMPQMAQQFAGHPSMPMATQAYYVQQPPLAHYYTGGQLSPTQAQSTMPLRQNMAYYANPMMINPQQPTYYYPSPNQFATQTQAMPNNAMAGQYMIGNPTMNDPRALNHLAENSSVHPQPLHKPSQGERRKEKRRNTTTWAETNLVDGIERRHSTVRGPPRKPKQSGEFHCLLCIKAGVLTNS